MHKAPHRCHRCHPHKHLTTKPHRHRKPQSPPSPVPSTHHQAAQTLPTPVPTPVHSETPTWGHQCLPHHCLPLSPLTPTPLTPPPTPLTPPPRWPPSRDHHTPNNSPVRASQNLFFTKPNSQTKHPWLRCVHQFKSVVGEEYFRNSSFRNLFRLVQESFLQRILPCAHAKSNWKMKGKMGIAPFYSLIFSSKHGWKNSQIP